MKTKLKVLKFLALLVSCVASATGAKGDVVIADFEGDTYAAGWTTTGEAFGSGPVARYPGQQAPIGHLGNGLANSFAGGDAAMGTLSSPPFKIALAFINFRIGGGSHAGETCMNLLLDGKPVRTATGARTKSGGSQQLEIASWDVTDLIGKQAVIQLVDQRSGAWGHILVDQIVQSNTPLVATEALHAFTAEKRFLHVPVKNGAPKRYVSVWREGEQVFGFDAEFAPAGVEPDFVGVMDLSRFAGQALTLKAGKFLDGDQAFIHCVQADELPNQKKIYKEKHRPQFHFTSKIGWLNDPNGLVYHEGEWHLYYQHNPYGWAWGNMHWGHAVSKDLVHWEEQPIALYQNSDTVKMAFSGCAVIDHKNTSGFGKDGKAPMVIALTDTGAGEILAYSNDNGRSFQMYEGNPVIKHDGRDPKISWHEASGRWVMALYSKIDEVHCMAFYSSPDLKTWTFESKNEDYYECPDLFELPVIGGKPGETRWVIHAGDAKYAVGHFDGKAFTPEHEGKHQVWFGNYFAAQSYDNSPGERRVQIGWARGNDFHHMPFNQQMAVAVELSLYNTPQGVRMAAYPVEEIKALRGKPVDITNKQLTSEAITLDPHGEGLDVEAEFSVGAAGKINLSLANAVVSYDAADQKLSVNGLDIDLAPQEGRITLRFLLDRGSIELFANGGRVAVLRGIKLGEANNQIALKGADATAESFTAWPMKSIWPR